MKILSSFIRFFSIVTIAVFITTAAFCGTYVYDEKPPEKTQPAPTKATHPPKTVSTTPKTSAGVPYNHAEKKEKKGPDK